MKHLFIILSLFFALPCVAQNGNVISALRAKYSLVQYHPECGGWYFISYQKAGQTLYGFADKNGNVVASDASQYKLHKGYIELLLLDAEKKAEHDQWFLDVQQYERDYHNYLKTKRSHESKLKAHNTKVEAARQEATRRWKYAQNVAVAKARREYQARQQQSSSQNTSVLGAVLSGLAQGFSEVAVANSVKFEPYLQEVLGERDLLVAPSEPYNPRPKKPVEPSEGYYWKNFSLLQPCPYEYIDFKAIAEVGHFANVKKDGRYGLVNSYMQEIVPCNYTSEVLQKKLTSDLFVIKQGGVMGVINAKAKTVIPCKYTSIDIEGSKIKVCENRKYGLFSLTGKVVMPCIFEHMENSNGYLLCQRDGLWGVYTTDFEELYPCQFQNEKFARVNGKLILCTQKKGLWGVVDFETGESLLPNNYANISFFNLGDKSSYLVKKDDKHGLYSTTGVLLLPCEYDAISTETFGAGKVFKVKKGETVGLYDLQGMPILKEGVYSDYVYHPRFIEVTRNGRRGICSPLGIELVPCKYDKLEWKEQLAVFQAQTGGRHTLVTLNGMELFPPVAATRMETPLATNQHIVISGPNNKSHGAIDYDGNLIVPMKNKRDKIYKKVAGYDKKYDLATSYKKKKAFIDDAQQKVQVLLNTETQEKSQFSYFAQNYVEKVINDWQKRGEFEKMEEWKKRVNTATRQQKVYALTKEAQNLYIENHTRNLKTDQVRIVGSYDAENETYRLFSSYAPQQELLVKVPFARAQEFKTMFPSLSRKPVFFVENDQIGLAEYVFTMPDGTSFKYSNQASLNYSVAQVNYNFDAIEIDRNAYGSNSPKGKQIISTKNIHFGTSDVDVNIPTASRKQEKVYVVIIANENYENEKQVEFAYNDGQIFREYCIKALGIPENHVHFSPDATLNKMAFEINWIKQIAKIEQDAKFIFYYAGHGVPEENLKDAYLLPTDGYSSDLSSGYKLSNLYATLGDIPAENVLVLLDACFGGSQRSGEHIASTRGVSIKVKLDAPKGNMVVFSASTGEQTAHPYREKYHGLFTYFLLKKIQEHKGEIKLGELADFVIQHVQKTALVNNSKNPQKPTISSSESMRNSWRNLVIN